MLFAYTTSVKVIFWYISVDWNPNRRNNCPEKIIFDICSWFLPDLLDIFADYSKSPRPELSQILLLGKAKANVYKVVSSTSLVK